VPDLLDQPFGGARIAGEVWAVVDDGDDGGDRGRVLDGIPFEQVHLSASGSSAHYRP
jgi:hypothetical protein